MTTETTAWTPQRNAKLYGALTGKNVRQNYFWLDVWYVLPGRGEVPDLNTYEGMGMVLEAMDARGWHWQMGRYGTEVSVEFIQPPLGIGPIGTASAPSLPLAVCLAAEDALAGDADVR